MLRNFLNITSNIFKTEHSLRLSKCIQTSYSTKQTCTFQQEFTVSPFCTLTVSCPFNVIIKPLDVFDYPNADKLFVKLFTDKSESNVDLECVQNKDSIQVSSTNSDLNVTCLIDAPVKANISLHGQDGSVDIGSFHNDFLEVTTTLGNITIDKFLSDRIKLGSINGRITCKNVTQASDINLCSSFGDIVTDRIQGVKLNAKTITGNIFVESLYCNDSHFKSKNGDINLNNAHKKCSIQIEEKGNLNLKGFDGCLEVTMNNGTADILLTRILEESKIEIENEGVLKLKLMDDCLNDTKFTVAASKCDIHDSISKTKTESSNTTILVPRNISQNTCLVNCKQSTVEIKPVTFMEMFNLRTKK